MMKRVGFFGAVVGVGIGAARSSRHRDNARKTQFVICGAGTGGCVTAYLLAKWLDEHKVPGEVLLLDAGDETLPDPRMSEWYNEWGRFSVLHDTSVVDDAFYPSPGSSHIGLGGCGAHDTRISFIPREEQRQEYAKLMDWSQDQVDTYLQLALNLMPLHTGPRETFYDAVIANSGLSRLPNDAFDGDIVPNSIGYVAMAMFPNEQRWASSCLLQTKPPNLRVMPNVVVDRVRLERRGSHFIATGVHVICNGRHEIIDVAPTGEVVLTAGALGTPAILQRSGIGPHGVLEPLGISVAVANDEVGHGVDHMEVPVTYKWIGGKELPRGGPTGWPLVLFATDDTDTLVMAHFGISPPPYGGGDVTATPNCARPDDTEGFCVQIRTTDPCQPAAIVHHGCSKDFDALSRGVHTTIKVMDRLQRAGVVGERTDPVDLRPDALREWMRTHVGTVYHWMSTCKASVSDRSVADEHFVVRNVRNLRVGSGAALPMIPEANPHVTITAFSVALAHELFKERLIRAKRSAVIPSDLAQALVSVTSSGKLQTRNASTVETRY